MGHRLKKCTSCGSYSISETSCHVCGGKLETVYPPKFSMEDRFQEYRIEYFREKMNKKFPSLKKMPRKLVNGKLPPSLEIP